MIDVGEGLKEITKNELFEEQRQIIQAEIISEHENKVKNFAIIKLIAIIVVAGGQLYLLKKMLDKQGYQPLWWYVNHNVSINCIYHDILNFQDNNYNLIDNY